MTITCDEFSSLSPPYGETRWHFFFFPLFFPSVLDSGLCPFIQLWWETGDQLSANSSSEVFQAFPWQPGSKNDRRGCSQCDWWWKKVLNAIYRAALFGWGRIAAGSKFLLTTSSSWQVALHMGCACTLSRGFYFFESLLLFFTQVTADWVLCRILRVENFQRENRSLVLTRLRVSSSACTSPEVIADEWNQASCRS